MTVYCKIRFPPIVFYHCRKHLLSSLNTVSLFLIHQRQKHSLLRFICFLEYKAAGMLQFQKIRLMQQFLFRHSCIHLRKSIKPIDSERSPCRQVAGQQGDNVFWQAVVVDDDRIILSQLYKRFHCAQVHLPGFYSKSPRRSKRFQAV